MVEAHPGSSFFHTSSWARVLHETYGHEPVYFGRASAEGLDGLLPVMEVSSPLTGRRGVSLPFTDFCLPLGPGANQHSDLSGASLSGLYDQAIEYGRQHRWRYLECRGNGLGWAGATPSLAFYGHSIDLRPGLEGLFKRCEPALRRGIRKAESTGLQVEFIHTLEAMREYYSLHCQTRRRHGVPPQPWRFFANIQRYALARGKGFVAIARQGRGAVAAAIFLHHRGQAIYKFGASDNAGQHLRPNNLMMWESMKHCRALGLESLHLGRTSLAHGGLRRFKLSLGATEERIEYCRYDFARGQFVTDVDRVGGWFNHVFRALPAPLLRLSGQLLYPHMS